MWQTASPSWPLEWPLRAQSAVQLLSPRIHKSNEDVAFLERVASTVERAQVIAPETREYLSKLTSRHQSPLADRGTGPQAAKALDRISAAKRSPNPMEGAVLSGRRIAE